MPRLILDKLIKRTEVDGFAFPLGVYPVEPMKPLAGYTDLFEAADATEPFISGPEDEGWEEWPDRFMFDVLVDVRRLPALVRVLTSVLPPRVFPILDVLGADEYREIDPYIAYDLVGLDRFLDGLRVYGPWLMEDGLVGFGAMSIEPFVYLFVDEHKILTVRVQLDLKDTVERVLRAFELGPVVEINGADAAPHEHRTVLPSPEESPDTLTGDDIVDHLRHAWMMQLNVPGDTNLDDEGVELGVTGWRVLARCLRAEGEGERFAEILLAADCLDTAEQLALTALSEQSEGDTWVEIDLVACDRLRPERLGELLGSAASEATAQNGICLIRWIAPAGPVAGDEPE